MFTLGPDDASPLSMASARSIRRYIMKAYGAIETAQIVGGSDWLDKEGYDIQGKVPDDLQAASHNMKFADRNDQDRSMKQSLLADCFHLKAHFETRILPVYELVPVKGGLKITPVPAPTESKPGDPPSPSNALPPGAVSIGFNNTGLHVIKARAIQIQLLTRIVAGSMNEAADRPVVDHTGFTGYFDIPELTWAPLGSADPAAPGNSDAPSLAAAIQDKFGIRVIPGKAPIEVLVIDHIERPDPN